MSELSSHNESPPPEGIPTGTTVDPVQSATTSAADFPSRRQQELLAAKLADPDPRAATLAVVAAEMFEVSSQLKNTILEVAATVRDPIQRLERLTPAVRTFGTMVNLAQKLT